MPLVQSKLRAAFGKASALATALLLSAQTVAFSSDQTSSINQTSAIDPRSSIGQTSNIYQTSSIDPVSSIDPTSALNRTSTFVYAAELAPVTFEENGAICEQLHVPIYSWTKAHTHPRGVILAVHGLAMHGKSFAAVGTKLAELGYAVYSLDLRGYGRCNADDHGFCVLPDCKHRINYDSSFDDIVRTARFLRELYPTVPLFGMGESLGGAMVIRLSATNPELVDGLVLSAPAIKHRTFIDPYLVADAGLVLANPRKQLDLTPFFRRFCSDDPRVVEETQTDPLVRRHLSAYELMQSSQTVRKTASFIDKIPKETPVLVIQGSADRCVKANAVMVLLSKLRSTDQTVKWFAERGHILLETAYVKPDTMDAVVGWLGSHVDTPAMQAKCNRTKEIVSQKSRMLELSAHAPNIIRTIANTAQIED